MKRNQGFILLAVLVFMQIYVLLGLNLFEQVFLAEKMNADQRARRVLLHEAEVLLSKLKIAWRANEDSCLIPVTTVNKLQARPLSWWADFACAREGSVYRSYYVVESLGEDPCTRPPVAYYRFTLLMANKQDEASKLMLQSTGFKETEGIEHCDNEQHSVDWGPHAGREF